MDGFLPRLHKLPEVPEGFTPDEARRIRAAFDAPGGRMLQADGELLTRYERAVGGLGPQGLTGGRR